GPRAVPGPIGPHHGGAQRAPVGARARLLLRLRPPPAPPPAGAGLGLLRPAAHRGARRGARRADDPHRDQLALLAPGRPGARDHQLRPPRPGLLAAPVLARPGVGEHQLGRGPGPAPPRPRRSGPHPDPADAEPGARERLLGVLRPRYRSRPGVRTVLLDGCAGARPAGRARRVVTRPAES